MRSTPEERRKDKITITIMANNNKENANASNTGGSKKPFYRNKKKSENATGNKPRLIREMKFHMHDSQQRKSSESFHRIKESIITKLTGILEHPAKIAESIRTMTPIALSAPELKASTKSTAEEKELDNRMLEMIFKINYERHMINQQALEENWVKTYALIWDKYCSREVQVALKEMPDFDTSVLNEPIVLLQRVENIMHTPMKAKYPPLTLVEVLISFLQIKQGDNESLLDYLSRFKSERNVMLGLVGKNIIDGYTERMSAYLDLAATDTAGQSRLKGEELNKFMAILFLRNAEEDRFGEMMIEYRKSFANKDNKYPKSVPDMIDVMRQQPEKKRKQKYPPTKKVESPTKKEEESASSFAQDKKGEQKKRTCYCCGEPGCIPSTCPKKGQAKDLWSKPEQFKESHTTLVYEERCFSGAQKVHSTKIEPEVIIDSGSSISLIKDKELLDEIHECKFKIIMETNAGTKRITEEGTMPDYGTVYYDPEAMTNLFSISDMVRKGNHVYLDTKEANCFVVTGKNGNNTRFSCDKRGLYVRECGKPENKVSFANNHVEGFTPRQVETARKVRKLYHDLNAPSISSLKAWIRQNMAKNIPISYDDVDLAEKVFKKDVPTLKGKGTRPHPPIVRTADNIKLPAELIHNGRKIELAIDVVYINDQSFLHSVDRSVKLNLLSALGTRKKGQNYDSDLLYAGINDVLRHYNKADIYVERIHADTEFRTLTKQLVDKWDVAMNFSLPGAHVPDISFDSISRIRASKCLFNSN